MTSTAGKPAGQRLMCRFGTLHAAALIRKLAGMTGGLTDTLRLLAEDSRESFGTCDGLLSVTLSDVIEVAEQTDGVQLGKLVTTLEPDAQVAEETLAEVLRNAANLPSEDEIASHSAISVMVAVAAYSGDQDATAKLYQVLDDMAKEPYWAVLADVLRRILDGQRDASLLERLDDLSADLARDALARIAVRRHSE